MAKWLEFPIVQPLAFNRDFRSSGNTAIKPSNNVTILIFSIGLPAQKLSYMKKILLTVVLAVTMVRSFADEGMWLPLLLGQQVYNDMVKRGLKLTKDQLYSINKPSVKDAIVIFNGG